VITGVGRRRCWSDKARIVAESLDPRTTASAVAQHYGLQGAGKAGVRIVRHGRYLVFQLAEVAVPRALFAEILRRIDRLRGPPVAAV
jgi:transposase-like protein